MWGAIVALIEGVAGAPGVPAAELPRGVRALPRALDVRDERLASGLLAEAPERGVFQERHEEQPVVPGVADEHHRIDDHRT